MPNPSHIIPVMVGDTKDEAECEKRKLTGGQDPLSSSAPDRPVTDP